MSTLFWHGIEEAVKIMRDACQQWKAQRLCAALARLRQSSEPPLAASVVICTYQRGTRLEQCLAAACAQQYDHQQYEIIVINNDPAVDLAPLLQPYREQYFAAEPGNLRLVPCHVRGLSFARNAGISAARGEVVAFLDDDAVPELQRLGELLRPYATNSQMGVVGGTIINKKLATPPSWLAENMYGYWSQLLPTRQDFYQCQRWSEFPYGANWSARRAALLAVYGFRASYGRRGKNFGAAEEIVCALLIQQVGYVVGVQPAARVAHDVEPERYRLSALWRNIQSGWLARLQMEQDGYLQPLARGWLNDGWHGVKRLGQAVGWGQPLAARLEHLFVAAAALQSAWRRLGRGFFH